MWLAAAVTGNRTGSPEPNAREAGMTHSQTSAGRSARTTENTAEISLEVNGISRRLAVDPRMSLLDLLRERLGLTGPKKGCDHGQCGACTVLIDGRRANACLALAVAHDGAAVTTVEGLAAGDDLHPLQDAFIRHDAFQCGYCTPGQLCSAAGMLTEPGPSAITADLETDPALTPGEIRERMSGNLCRCGAYVNIVRAITSAGQGS
jgi:xanthine dehydrogenase YagT iron-sulfur-binding subunit